MKMKSDFVTNSSSLSMIISPTSPSRVAIHMLMVQIEEIGSWQNEEEWGREKIEIMEKEIEFLRSEEGSKLKHIHFPWGVNYETYVFDLGFFQVGVDTCNNIRWDDDKYICSLTKEVSDGWDTIEGSEITDETKFFDLASHEWKTREELLRW